MKLSRTLSEATRVSAVRALVLVLALAPLGGVGQADEGAAAPADAPADQDERTVETFIDINKRLYKRRTERLRAILGALGWNVPPPAEAISLPEPRQITITTTRRTTDAPPAVRLSGRDFLSGVTVRRLPFDTKHHRTSAAKMIMPDSITGGDPPSPSQIYAKYGTGKVYAADDFTAKVLGLPRTIPLEVKGSIAHIRPDVLTYTFEWKGRVAKRKGTQKRAMRVEKIEPEQVPDLRSLLKAGRGDINSIGIDLSGTNLELDAAQSCLRPASAGPIKMPGEVTWERLIMKGYRFLTDRKYAKGIDRDRVEIVYLPDKAHNFSFSENRNTARKSGKKEEQSTAVNSWRHGGRRKRSWNWRPWHRRVPDPYEGIPEHEPSLAVSLEGTRLLVTPLRRAQGVGQAGSDTTDFFFESGTPDMPAANVNYVAVVHDGAGETLWEGLAGEDAMETTGGPFSLNTRVIRPLGTPGETKITMSLPMGRRGKGAWSKSHTFTANEVSFRLHAPLATLGSGSFERLGRTIPIGRPVGVSVTVRGPADMSRYRVKWDNFSDWIVMKQRDLTNRDLKFAFREASSSFTQAGDVWTAATELTVTEASVRDDLAAIMQGSTRGAPFCFPVSSGNVNVSGVLTEPGGRGVLRLRSDWAGLSSPALTKIELKGAHILSEQAGMDAPPDAEPGTGPFDVFLTGGDAGVKLLATLHYGTEEPLVVENVEIGGLRNGWINIQQDVGHILAGRDGRVIGGEGKTGKGQVRAVVRRQAAARSFVTLPEGVDSLTSESLEVTVNRVFLARVFTGREEWTVSVDGPADMSKYSTKWYTRNGRTASAAFRRGSWLSSASFKAGTRLDYVDVVDDVGTPVARLSAANTTTLAAGMWLQTADRHFVQGQAHEVEARVGNLAVEHALRAWCRWSIPDEFEGIVGSRKTRLTLAKGFKPSDPFPQYSTSTLVQFRDLKKTAGKVPKIIGELIYKGVVIARAELSDVMLLPGAKTLEELSPDELGLMQADYRVHQRDRRRRVEIIRVVPINGNNPFNTSDPINNRTVNGVVIGEAVDAQDDDDGGGGGGGTLQAWSGQQPFGVFVIPGSGDRVYFAGIDVNMSTKAVSLRNDGQGQTLICQSPPDNYQGGAPIPIVSFPDRVVRNWEFTPPSPQGGPGVVIQFNPNAGQQTIYVQAINGVKLRLTISVTAGDVSDPSTYTLIVHDISEI